MFGYWSHVATRWLAGQICCVSAEVQLRAARLVLVVRVVRHAAAVDVVVLREAAGGNQLESGTDVRALHRREQPLADDEVAFAFVVARGSALAPRGLDRTCRTGVASRLVLRVLVERE